MFSLSSLKWHCLLASWLLRKTKLLFGSYNLKISLLMTDLCFRLCCLHIHFKRHTFNYSVNALHSQSVLLTVYSLCLNAFLRKMFSLPCLSKQKSCSGLSLPWVHLGWPQGAHKLLSHCSILAGQGDKV